jgi:hypothetical protein
VRAGRKKNLAKGSNEIEQTKHLQMRWASELGTREREEIGLVSSTN